MSKPTAPELLKTIAKLVSRRGFEVDLPGDINHLYGCLTPGPGLTLLAHVLDDGRLRIAAAQVWDGHSHVVVPGRDALTVTPGSRKADPTDLVVAIVDRIRVREAAIASCPHRREPDGICPECGQPVPLIPLGMKEALDGAARVLRTRGLRGDLRIRTNGPGLMVTWHSSASSRIDIEQEALHIAEEQLLGRSIDAALLPGCPWVHVAAANRNKATVAQAA